MRRLAFLPLLLALTGPAPAGEPYKPVRVGPGETVTAPEDLRQQASRLLAAAKAGDAAAAGLFIADEVLVVSHGLDLSAEPRVKRVTAGADPAGRIVALGGHTGGDGGGPIGPDGKPVDLIGHLTRSELDFIVQSLTDGQPWGRDPKAKGTVCSYAAPKVDRKAVDRAAKILGVSGSNFRSPVQPTDLLAKPEDGAAVVGRIEPGLLYAVDYDASEPIGWVAIHLPEGGTGFAATGADGLLTSPYVSGICFARSSAGDWSLVAQVATGL